MGFTEFMAAREESYFNRCVYCKEIFTGYKNEAACPVCVSANAKAVNNIFKFSNEK